MYTYKTQTNELAYMSLSLQRIFLNIFMLYLDSNSKNIFLTIYKCIGVESRNITSRIIFLSQYKKRVNNYILKSGNLYMMILF